MHIGMLTTWRSKCGIADYSDQLIDRLLSLGVDVTVFANYGDNSHTSYKTTRYNNTLTVISDMFGVHWWGEPDKFETESLLKWISNLNIDALHIQYQASLYNNAKFLEFINKCPIPITYTLHDSSVQPGFAPKNNIIVHNPQINKHGYYIPFPLTEIRPWAISLGMGRNDVELVKDVCINRGIGYIHHDGKLQWLNHEDLIDYTKGFDVGILWYDEVGLVGNSAAARLIISCRIPLIVNNVGWFSDLVSYKDKVIIVNDIKELDKALDNVLLLSTVQEQGYTNCARKHISYYEKVISKK